MFWILVIITIVCAVAGTIGLISMLDYGDLDFLGLAWIIALLTGMAALTLLGWNLGESYYTGYIYSADQEFGIRTYHIRFSQNAGEDSQPSFCTTVGSETDEKLLQYVGSNTKVSVKIPAGFKIKSHFFECAFEPEDVQEVE